MKKFLMAAVLAAGYVSGAIAASCAHIGKPTMCFYNVDYTGSGGYNAFDEGKFGIGEVDVSWSLFRWAVHESSRDAKESKLNDGVPAYRLWVKDGRDGESIGESIIVGATIGKKHPWSTMVDLGNISGVNAFVQVLHEAGDEGEAILETGRMTLEQYDKFLQLAVERAFKSGDVRFAFYEGKDYFGYRGADYRSQAEKERPDYITVLSSIFFKLGNDWYYQGSCFTDTDERPRASNLRVRTEIAVQGWLDAGRFTAK